MVFQGKTERWVALYLRNDRTFKINVCLCEILLEDPWNVNTNYALGTKCRQDFFFIDHLIKYLVETGDMLTS